MSEIVNKGSGSSEASSFNGSIVIYQHGIGGSEDDLYETIRRLVQSNTFRNQAYLDDFVNMNDFNVSTKKFNSNSEKEKAENILDEIVRRIEETPTKNIHFRTRLGGFRCYDSIDNQVEKLIYIIKYLVDVKKVNKKIVLVGHSQGGLVNIKTAIALEGYIDQLISISTPYDPVDMGASLLTLYNIAKFFNIPGVEKILTQSDVDMDDPNQQALIKEIKTGAEVLTNRNYFKKIHEDWKNAKNKPKLHVISGTAGTYRKSIVVPSSGLGSSLSPSYGTDLELTVKYLKTPFDGIVMTSEQYNIEYDTYHPLCDISLPCIKNGTYKFKSYCGECYLGCPLSSFDLEDTVIDAFFTGLSNWIKGKGFQIDAKADDLTRALVAGMNRSEYSGNYTNVYRILKNSHSHMWLRYNETALYCVRSHIE
ncbi:MAG: GPI inositol-deacylase [Ureaplasma sp.]|nr:GPI inositol-deacylase [Ureaplasma sp.]MDE7263886.1 GPI inositol-deacylase [Anaeroplasmataceae bacterium]